MGGFTVLCSYQFDIIAWQCLFIYFFMEIDTVKAKATTRTELQHTQLLKSPLEFTSRCGDKYTTTP